MFLHLIFEQKKVLFKHLYIKRQYLEIVDLIVLSVYPLFGIFEITYEKNELQYI